MPQMLAHTVAMSSAGPISACDPQGVAAALAIRRARLTEATLNAMIQKDAEDNEFANFWQLPDLQLSKCYITTTVVLLFLQKRPKLGREYLVMSSLVAFASFCI